LLSYRHAFHAGNFADVIKHIVLVEILQSLAKKDKAFAYYDTHAGAGLYNLHSSHAQKLAEFNTGIAKLIPGDWPEIAPFFDAVRAYNPSKSLSHYPGSPMIAAHFLRRQDQAWLFELHPKDFQLLEKNTSSRKIKCQQEDGLAGLPALLPPASRRGLILIDPSYEVKSEYEKVFFTVNNAYKKFSTGIYALWYPVIDRKTIDQLEKRFVKSGIKNIQRYELGLLPDSDEHGMTASGMIVINPPWDLLDKMSQLLPKLARSLGEQDKASYKCDILAGE
jgi:23S rRNA (adenine2030-N6)-methyltransferase